MDESRLNRPRVAVTDLACDLPHVPQFEGEETLDVASIAAKFIQDIESALTHSNWSAFAELWTSDSWWRDSLTLTFDKRTLHGKDTITAAWKELTAARPVSNFGSSSGEVYGLQASFTRLAPEFATLDVPFAFSTDKPKTRCVGLAKLIREGQNWKIWILSTGADHLEVHPFQMLPRQNQSMIDASQCGNSSAQGLPRITGILDAIVIGGSAAGIANATMLQSIGANVAVVDMEMVPGGLWSTNRYECFRLHHSKFMSQLPMLPPPDDVDEYMTGKQLTSYMSAIVEELGLPFYGGIHVINNQWDESSKVWNVLIKDILTSNQLTLHSKNIVMSNGFLIGNSTPRYPDISGRHLFSGPVEHTAKYRNAQPYVGRNVVVVGAGNSAHDVADDLVRGGAKTVTILQKSPIVFLNFDLFIPIVSMLYQGQMSVDAADFISGGLPTSVQRQMINPAVHGAVTAMGDRNRILEEKGYMLNKEPDLVDAALSNKGSKFYVDHPNTFDLLVQDKIKVVRGEATQFVSEGVTVRNGDEQYILPADGVVLATGYETIDLPQRWAESGFIDSQSAAKIENVNRFGVDAEGEFPGFTTFSGHDHLYFSGLGFAYNRSISRYTAIQVMADKIGEFPPRLQR